MKIITALKELQQTMKEHKNSQQTIGFVPTMGFLHEGHLKLMHEARRQNDILIISIFVNPLQFGENEDFDSYPRNMERDTRLAKEAGADYIFAPSVNEMYKNEPSVTVRVEKRTDVLCGKSRAGHFDGVATVLSKLFNLVGPDRAYFGMKDAQQVAVISGLISDFHFPVQLVPVQTVREEDGLAKSSRNVYLSEEERKQAPHLYKALQAGKDMMMKGEKSPAAVTKSVSSYLSAHTDGVIDYVEIYSYPELETLAELKGNLILAVAVKFTKARLIDNITIELN
ncbi:pantoate--beta-alanine ligase [Metabacillus idriensis]|uniref:Pantothenate synthetase n=1 Tax=Metabacillus idriensis TaxID=324768 RepID=A0A6I2MEG8_9BACI|nr:pantoate--beta-alanine ligase [Metabacillus idriensis]MCM3596919.1 pantoate--beta-alanine ligase [Metabacillus idriensis]MRX55734.1 pantoate--beta-alanine ligase [Metabacillus idriensis]